MQLWRLIINDVKLNVSLGSSFCCTDPGFFRVCFANMDDQTVKYMEENPLPSDAKIWVFEVSINCEGCKKKVIKILHKIQAVSHRGRERGCGNIDREIREKDWKKS